MAAIPAYRPIPNGLEFGVPIQEPTQIITGDGAITIPSGTVVLTKGSAAAITLAAPTAQGLELTVISDTAHAHTVDMASTGVNGGAADVGTFGGAVYDRFTLVSILVSGIFQWYVKAVTNVTFA